MAGACLGFLWHNAHPADIFMGDTGALALGGSLGTMALLTGHPLLLVIVGGLFVIETLSVILQVVSFKFRGKRIFKMAPIHHHFELLGWHESKVIIRFWIVALIFAILAPEHLQAEVMMKRLIVGMGVTGRAVAAFLANQDQPLETFDDRQKADSGTSKSPGSPAHHCDPHQIDLTSFGEVVVSPGIPPNHPLLTRAREKGIPVVGEIELAYRHCPGRLIAGYRVQRQIHHREPDSSSF